MCCDQANGSQLTITDFKVRQYSQTKKIIALSALRHFQYLPADAFPCSNSVKRDQIKWDQKTRIGNTPADNHFISRGGTYFKVTGTNTIDE